MRKIAHLSDLHFGRTDPVALPALAATLARARPDIVVVSGDLTQRAKNHEFAAARAWLDGLALPLLVVPGNHDVPLYNIFMRAFHPLTRYRRHFGANLAPFHVDAEMAIVGVNTARALTFKDGRINREQVATTCRQLHTVADDAVRIVVTHHPFDQAGREGESLVGREAMAMQAFAGCRVDLILSGHLHTSMAGPSARRCELNGHSALIVQAGTATSIRRRGEPNSFNMIHVERRRIAVERWQWKDADAAFAIAGTEHFSKTGGEWRA